MLLNAIMADYASAKLNKGLPKGSPLLLWAHGIVLVYFPLSHSRTLVFQSQRNVEFHLPVIGCHLQFGLVSTK